MTSPFVYNRQEKEGTPCRMSGKGFLHSTQQAIRDRWYQTSLQGSFSDKNLLALIDNPKPFIMLVFPRLAPLSLVFGEHFVLKDLPFYEVARLVDSEARQAHLEEREIKR